MKTTRRAPLFTILLALGVALGAGLGCDDKGEGAPSEEAVEQALAEGGEEEVASAEGGEEAEVAKKGDELPEHLAPGEKKHFGAPFSNDDEPISLASALAKMSEAEGPYKVEAKVETVCKKKGCWFTLAADGVEVPIRVRMKDYAFFISRNTDGAQVVLEGTLKKVVVPQEMAQHFADDEVEGTGKKAEQIEGDQETYEFMATGVEISQPAA